MQRSKLFLTVMLLFLTLPTAGAEAARYRLTEIVFPAQTGSKYANSLNDRGQVVGYFFNYSLNTYQAYRWQDGVMTILPPLSASDPRAFARGINNLGQVVGSSGDVACCWNNDVPTALGSLGGAVGAASDVNDLGQIVGKSRLAGTNDQHAFLWQNGVMTDLGTLGGPQSEALGINNVGQVVGKADTELNNIRPFLWDHGTMIDLGTLAGGSWTEANAINHSRQVVGSSRSDEPIVWRGFLWQNDVMTDLGTLGGEGSSAKDINNLGQIVGKADTPTDSRAYLWEKGTMIDLNTLIPSDAGIILVEACSINNRGQIVCKTATGVYLLTPVALPPLSLLLFTD